MQRFFYVIITICLFLAISCEGIFAPVKAPAISATKQEDGSYSVTMDAGRNGSIFYTTDGSEPEYPGSPIYLQDPVTIAAGVTVRAISYCPSGRKSSETVITLVSDVNNSTPACE